jgi:photosystem II stability/assembly factor-like uncharacterized protein
MSTAKQLPIPDPVDLDRVETFTASPVFDDLFDLIVHSQDRPAGEAVLRETRLRSAEFSPRGTSHRVRTVLVAAGVVALVAAGLTAFVQTQSAQSRPGVRTTVWRAARPVLAPTQTLPKNPSDGMWQLVDDLANSSWQQNTTGPPPGGITCPSVTACYGLSESYASPRAGAPLLGVSLYVSGDLGQTWSVLPVPARFRPTSELSCGTPVNCFVAGLIGRAPMFLSTSDGGHQWTLAPFDGGGILRYLACADADTCTGVMIPIADTLLSGTQGPDPATAPWSLVHTTDAGGSWTSFTLPARTLVTGLSCGTAEACVVSGTDGTARSGLIPGFVLSTIDGGSHWRTGSAPDGFTFGGESQVSCSTATDCMAIGGTVASPTQCGPPPRAVPPGGIDSGCSSGPSQVSAPLVTDDGGLTWTARTLPSDVPNPQLVSVSCPSPTVCWLSGQEAVPIVIGNVHDEGSSVILGTDDGGATWQRVTFSVPAGAPNYYGQSYLSMGPISCPTTKACVALGAVAQGSKTTPIYSYRAPG